jgi:hypothetical protein
MILGFCKCPKQGYNDDETLPNFIKWKHAKKGHKKEQGERTQVLEHKQNPKKRANHQEEGEHIMFPILPHSQETSKGLCLKNLTKIHIIVGVF